jgi:hypothetical protein
MEKEFVSYEQALALKELGFHEECFAWYNYGELLEFGNDHILDMYAGEDKKPVAPLKQQVFRWFREKYEFCYHIFSLQITASDKTGYRYSWEIYNHTPEWIAEDSSLLGSLTYEEAENACIDKLIELVKNK